MNIAIVGCGAIAHTHATSIFNIGGNNLVAFADIRLDRAEEFSKKFGGKAYSSLEEMIEMEKIHVLHICTPHYLHTAMALYALELGVHVFMEKPPVISKEQLSQLEQIHSNARLGFCFQNRYNPSVIKVKEMLSNNELGSILGVRGILTWNRPLEYYKKSDWRGRLETEGGGVLINQAIHTMDLMQYFIGDKPVSVDAMITNHHLKDEIEVEDTMSAWIQYPKLNACFYATSAYCKNSAPLIELECEKGTIRLEDMVVTYYEPDGTVNSIPIERKVGYGKSYWGAGHEDCIRDFYRCITNEQRFPQDLDGIKQTIELMLAAYESGRTHQVIYL